MGARGGKLQDAVLLQEEAHATTAPDFMVYPGVGYGFHLENFSS
jgi:hypothetical protein